jgi:pimeloyl-ACP methyl ester carboxylesterase
VARRLSAEARAPLHARLAEALRGHGGDPAEVARHLAGSGDRSAAAGAYAEAARLALDRFANEQATRLVDQALAIAEHLGHREWTIMGHHRLGVAWEAAEDPQRAEGAYRRGLELADRVPYHWSQCANGLARLLIARGELDAAEPLIARSLAEGLPLTAYEARAAQVELLAARGEEAAWPLAREAMALAEQGGCLAVVSRLRALTTVPPSP